MFNLKRFWPVDIDGDDQDDEPDSGPPIDWSKVTLLRSEAQFREKRAEQYEAGIEPMAQVLDVYEASPTLRWTSTPPNVEGLFFVRTGPGQPTRVVDVFRVHGTKWCAEWSDLGPIDVATCGYQFSDFPIREPR